MALKMNLFSVAILIFIFQIVYVTCSCGEYGVKVTKVVSYPGNNAKIEPTIRVSLSSDCILTLEGCLTLDRPFTNATITFDAHKYLMWTWVKFYSLKDDNVCKRLEEFNLPKCPLNAGRYCNAASNGINIKKYEALLGAAEGDVKVVNATVKYDNCAKLDSFDLFVTVFKTKA